MPHAPPDPLRLAVVRAFVARLARSDRDGAALVAAEADRLEQDDEATRAAEREALDGPAGRAGQLPLRVDGPGEVNLVAIEAARAPAELHLWAWDDDACSLRAGKRPSDDLVLALRAAFARGARWRAASLHLTLFGPVAPVLRELDRVGARDLVRSVDLRSETGDPPPDLGEALPALRSLTARLADASTALAAGHPALEHLRVDQGGRALAAVLRDVERLHLPALRDLAVVHGEVGPRDLAAVARSWLVARLVTLDLFRTNEAAAFPFDALAAARPELDHLDRVVLGGHLVPPRVHHRFEAWPAVTLASWDRRALLAFDLATSGWPVGLR